MIVKSETRLRLDNAINTDKGIFPVELIDSNKNDMTFGSSNDERLLCNEDVIDALDNLRPDISHGLVIRADKTLHDGPSRCAMLRERSHFFLVDNFNTTEIEHSKRHNRRSACRAD